MKKIAVAAVGLALIGASSSAFAQNVGDEQIKQNLEAQGYSNLRISRHEKSHIDVTGTKGGQVEKLAVNPKTGQISTDTDNDKD